MVGVIDGFQWSLLAGKTDLDQTTVLTSIGVVVFLLVTGVWYFRKMERTFADVI
jgi:lipopolysaccharide transport system permease protein